MTWIDEWNIDIFIISLSSHFPETIIGAVVQTQLLPFFYILKRFKSDRTKAIQLRQVLCGRHLPEAAVIIPLISILLYICTRLQIDGDHHTQMTWNKKVQVLSTVLFCFRHYHKRSQAFWSPMYWILQRTQTRYHNHRLFASASALSNLNTPMCRSSTYILMSPRRLPDRYATLSTTAQNVWGLQHTTRIPTVYS